MLPVPAGIHIVHGTRFSVFTRLYPLPPYLLFSHFVKLQHPHTDSIGPHIHTRYGDKCAFIYVVQRSGPGITLNLSLP